MKYLAGKLAYAALVFLGVYTLVFILFQGLGDPAQLIIGQTGDKKTLDNIRKDLYLDKPLINQYFLALNDLSPLSLHTGQDIEQKGIRGLFIGGTTKIGLKVPYLRNSYQSKRNVIDVLLDALPGTIILAGTAMLLAIIFGIGIGVMASLKPNSFFDRAIIFLSTIGISAPSFFAAIIIAYLFGWLWHSYTGLPLTGSLFTINAVTGEKMLTLRNLILPAITLGIRPLAIITQLTRSSMLDVLQQDYIRTAYAKGLKRSTIIIKHALPNAVNPIITSVTGWFAELLAGAFFIEYIFGWHGLGKITVNALEKLDYPVVLGAVLLSAFIFILVNLLADFLYKLFDPRLR